nr:hypothetical protein [Pleurocapsa sp. CCALA 161]
MPRIEITLSQIQYNARMLCELYGEQGISLMGVSKAVLGEPLIAEAMIRGGVKFIADSRLENIQSKVKPSVPFGEIGRDAFGNIPVFKNCGTHQRAIIALGKQDTLISGLSPDRDLEILGSSSDHLVLDSQKSDLKVGVGVNFNLDYGSLLSAMTSPFIKKQFIN